MRAYYAIGNTILYILSYRELGTVSDGNQDR